jgi:hypothetical protein
MVIEVTPGKDAEEIEHLLCSLKAGIRCWVDGDWKFMPVSQLKHRTDVWVVF